jgi:hypothetical protein
MREIKIKEKEEVEEVNAGRKFILRALAVKQTLSALYLAHYSVAPLALRTSAAFNLPLCSAVPRAVLSPAFLMFKSVLGLALRMAVMLSALSSAAH